jgi:hypothetical protein
MRRAIYVPLPGDASERLYELAQREHRRTREQALVLLLDGLQRAGMEPLEEARTRPEAAMAAAR